MQIDRDKSDLYYVRILDGLVTLFSFQVGSISDALRIGGADTQNGLAGFHIWYGHVCIGTTSLHAMRHDAETLAQRLVSLHSQFGE